MSCDRKGTESTYSNLRYSRYSPSGYNTYTNKGWCDGDVCEFHDQCASNNCNDEGFCVGNGDENSALGLIISLVMTACFCLTCCMILAICMRRLK